MPKVLLTRTLILFLVVFTSFFSNSVLAQCGTGGPNEGGTLVPTGSWQTVSVGSGTYVDIPVNINNFYSFRYINSNLLYNNGNRIDMTLAATSGIINYNDNFTPILNPWTGGICPPNTNNRPTSTDWFASYTGILSIYTKTFDLSNICQDWVSGQNSAILQYKTCPAQPDPGVGVNQWNVDVFATTDISIPNINARYGSYSTGTVSFNTALDWAPTSSPSSASNWNGCEVPPDKFTIRARRRGFPCQPYALTINSADDGVSVFVNGSQIYNGNLVSNVPLGTYVLSSNDEIEVRMTGLCNPENIDFAVTPVAVPPVNGGTIGGITNGSTICQSDYFNATLTNLAPGSGGVTGFTNGGAFTYSWELSSDNITFTPISGANGITYAPQTILAPGTYYIRRRATDQCGNFGFSNVISFTISPPPTATISPSSQVICPGKQAVLTVTLTNGVAPFDIEITDGVNFFQRFGKNSGDTVMIPITVSPTTLSISVLRDNNNCISVNLPGSVFVTISQPINISGVVATSVSCFGGNDGTITITASGGTPPFQYSIDNGLNFQVSNVFTGLSAGPYNVVVRDNLGCTEAYIGNPVQISQPTPITATSAVQDASCNGVFDGVISITASGGLPGYTYSLNGGPSFFNPNITGLGAGIYTIIVTDTKGCTVSVQDTVNNTYSISSTVSSQTDVSCYNGNDGAFTVAMSGGIPPYQHSINGGLTYQNSPTFSGLEAGNYTIKSIDSKGCPAIVSITIAEPPKIHITVDSIANANCFGASTGSIFLSTQGGTPGYTFAWNNGSSNEDLIGVGAGKYRLTVIDSRGCSDSISVTVGQPTRLFLSIASFTNVSCNGGINGTVDITVGGGTLPYTFLWNNGHTGEDLVGIAGGTYSVTVTDANGCFDTISQTISEPQPLGLSLSSNNILCHGSQNGSITTVVTGGTNPYRYLWSTGDTTANLSNLRGGVYTVVVTDLNNCSISGTITIAEPAPLVLTANVQQISCFNANDGIIDLSVNGGTPGFTYSWSNGATTQDLTNLSAGTYTVSVTDNNQCFATNQFVITNPNPIVITKFITKPTCAGDADGKIDLVVSGGVPLYRFVWSNSDTTEDISNLSTGTYIVTVTDSRNCTAVDTARVGEPQPLFTTGFIKDVTCKGDADGFIDITAYGGTLPYYFLWSKDSIITEDIGSLVGGTYYVTVTDGNGCTVSGTYFVYEPDSLKISFSQTNVTCPNGNNGKIAPIVTGGNYPYFFTWNNSSGDSIQSNLSAGTYVLMIEDRKGCKARDSIRITEPLPFNVSSSIINASCSGKTDGSIKISVSGGNGNYLFAWSTGNTTDSIGGVGAGTYIVTITDALGCSFVDSFTITESQQMVADVAVINPTCSGGTTGMISVDVTGGDAPYAYSWSTTPPQTNNTASNLSAGTYTVTITDSKGCTITQTRTLTDPAPITVQVNTTGSKCLNVGSGTVKAQVKGGIPPYVYFLNGSAQASDSFFGLLPGNYVLLVRDVNGCEGIISFTVPLPSPFIVDLTADKEVILSGMEVQLNTVVSSDTNVLSYIWQPLGFFNYSGCNDTLNCPNPKVSPLITTTFAVTVENAHGCIASDTLTITVLNQQSLFIPSAFSPNGDGLNDRFEFDILGVKFADVRIFDRWGNIIFEKENQKNGIGQNEGWDGTFKGAPVQLDTYVYHIVAKYFDGTEKKITGTIAVMR
jgi:gliding motility-associated-like protein